MNDDRGLILVIDDENDARGYLYELLDSEGYRVATAAGGMEGIKYASAHKPQVVIADVRMPEMDGFEAVERIRDASPSSRLILISAHGDRDTLMRALQKGVDGFLEKPYENAAILDAVSRALQRTVPS